MKKTAVLLSSLVLSLGSLVSLAQQLPSLQDLFAWATWWYDNNYKISIDSITDQEIKIKTPIIYNTVSDGATYYNIWYITGQAFSNQTINHAEKVISANTTPTTTDGLSLTIGTSDGLQTGLDYFAIVVPVDRDDNKWKYSEQICFNLSQQQFNTWDACNTFKYSASTIINWQTVTENNTSANNSHTSSNLSWDVNENLNTNTSLSNMRLANVRHTITWDIITLLWTAVWSAQDIAISVMWPGDTGFSRVATVKMRDEKYNYRFSRDGEYIFRFIPSDWWTEITYNLTAKAWLTNPTSNTPVSNPPKTWPTENAIAIIVLAVLVFGGYILFGKKNA